MVASGCPAVTWAPTATSTDATVPPSVKTTAAWLTGSIVATPDTVVSRSWVATVAVRTPVSSRRDMATAVTPAPAATMTAAPAASAVRRSRRRRRARRAVSGSMGNFRVATSPHSLRRASMGASRAARDAG